ncbi:MAG: CtsR family transcriptional regulator [Firmicutes bacterium]|nr:CtsR family transcriptional regulator [Bacillota bacterium]
MIKTSGDEFLRLSDEIEKYIKALLAKSPTGQVEIRRNSLAVYFNCVPSQINYVLATRFTLRHGFYVESRRGGGGFLRISKLQPGNREELAREIIGYIGETVSSSEAVAVVERLEMEGLLSPREAILVRAAVSTGLMKETTPVRNRMRAAILKAIVGAVLGR